MATTVGNRPVPDVEVDPIRSAREIEAFLHSAFEKRNQLSREFFNRESLRLATACREMSSRFLAGGRLLAFGRGPHATDAQHVAVEFVHPVIVGKRALPALDLSADFEAWVDAIASPNDMVMGFGAAVGDPHIEDVLARTSRRGAMTFALPGSPASATFAIDPPSFDPFVDQEIVEVLYHTLWETVHVFFEHRELGHEVGEAGFLYPFLGQNRQDVDELVAQVAASIRLKAIDDVSLRDRALASSGDAIVAAIRAIDERLACGGKLLMLGNGGSATDATDWAIDCVHPPDGYRPVPALSLALEPATITAISNDVGIELCFLRQLIAHARPGDVAIALSTSGGSKNVVAALEHARRLDLFTIGLLGGDGGEIVRRSLVDAAIVVPSDYIPRIQEVQASIYHVMRAAQEGLTRGRA
jgi:D-sedoheptulose 7-phosphate isomerase